jgi:F420-dependent oxidoreductase-like protein
MWRSDPIRFGAVLNYAPELIAKSDWQGLKRIALECERLGYDSIWVMDHFTYHGLPAVMECYTTLAALAAVTSRIRLGCLVTCISYRHPPVAAKMAATLDVISNGRLEFGIGAGWKEDEYLMYGIEYPRPRVRIEQLRESVQVIKKMWTEPGASFNGKYYRIENMDFGPKLVQKPHPPVWIGGSGEKYLLRVVAELGDYSNMSASLSREEYRHKMRVLRRHCETVGKRYDELRKSLSLEVHIGRTEGEARRKMVDAYEHQYFEPKLRIGKPSLEQYASRRLVGTPEQCVSQLKKWLGEDIDYILVGWTMTLDDWALFAEEVIPAFK